MENMYRIYMKTPNSKRFKSQAILTDSFERADRHLESMIRWDNEHGRRGNLYQIRQNSKIVREVEN